MWFSHLTRRVLWTVTFILWRVGWVIIVYLRNDSGFVKSWSCFSHIHRFPLPVCYYDTPFVCHLSHYYLTVPSSYHQQAIIPPAMNVPMTRRWNAFHSSIDVTSSSSSTVSVLPKRHRFPFLHRPSTMGRSRKLLSGQYGEYRLTDNTKVFYVNLINNLIDYYYYFNLFRKAIRSPNLLCSPTSGIL